MSELRYLGITSDPGGKPPHRLMLATPSGRIREIVLQGKDIGDLLCRIALIASHSLKESKK